MAFSESEVNNPLSNAQVPKRPAESPLSALAGKKQRAKGHPGSSSSEDLDCLWPAGSPNEVSFLHFQLRTSTPKAQQELGSVGAEAKGHPPDPRLVRIKEEQVPQKIK